MTSNFSQKRNVLVFIPTFNESGNIREMVSRLLALGQNLDLLFLDDNSPDGTGRILDSLALEHSNIRVIHRPKKMGIGSAHYEGILWAYQHGYSELLTMDADFTHSPERILEILEEKNSNPNCDIVVASRFLKKKSLSEWNMWRKFLTHFGHILTRVCLGMEYDATGAFRFYRLSNIPKYAFHVIRSTGYSFFFESLYIFHRNGFRIRQIPVDLPARTYGSSKMTFREIGKSVRLLVTTYFISVFNPEKFQIIEPLPESHLSPQAKDPQGWDEYWDDKKQTGGLVYDACASIYRKWLIGPTLAHFLKKSFPEKTKLLHAGCGSGQVDLSLEGAFDVTALDISPKALQFYRKMHGTSAKVIHGSIFSIPVPDSSFDGAYNLGVMEHFTEEEIQNILRELRRVVRPGGKIVLFWPPEFGLTVNLFKFLSWTMKTFLNRPNVKFHPDEITRVRSRAHAEELIQKADLSMKEYYFGSRDLFTQVALVCSVEKESDFREEQTTRKRLANESW